MTAPTIATTANAAGQLLTETLNFADGSEVVVTNTYRGGSPAAPGCVVPRASPPG